MVFAACMIQILLLTCPLRLPSLTMVERHMPRSYAGENLAGSMARPAMLWVIVAGIVVVALIANEIRLAPEQDDDYEVHLREHYRKQAIEESKASAEKQSPRRPDAA